MYLSYAEYQSYGGSLDETTYNNYAFEAEALINYYTFDRLRNDTVVQETVKRLMFVLVSVAQKRAASLSLGVSSTNTPNSPNSVFITRQSNDGVDTTYSGMDATDVYTLCNTEVLSAINKYLANVMNEAGRKVLYRGFYPGE